MSSIKYFLFFISFLFMPVVMQADSTATSIIDTTIVTSAPLEVKEGLAPSSLRAFDDKKLSAYLEDEDFLYDREPEGMSLWERIKRWLAKKLLELLTTEGSWVIMKYMAYAIAIALIIYIILKLLKMDIMAFFYGKSKASHLPYTEEQENIHAMSFDELIAQAVKEENYRRAVRLYYLRSLKELSDRDLIRWKIDKTNRDYTEEIEEKNLKSKFEEITLLFEFVWYGEFQTGKAEYEQALVYFNEFSKDLQKR